MKKMDRITAWAGMPIVAVLFLLSSCKKNDDTATPNPSAPQKIDAKALKSSWRVVSLYSLFYDSTGRLTQSSGISKTYHASGIDWNDTMESVIAFADGTYACNRLDGSPGGFLLDDMMPASGTWQLKSDSTVLQMQVLPTIAPSGLYDFKVFKASAIDINLSWTFPHTNKSTVETHLEFIK